MKETIYRRVPLKSYGKLIFSNHNLEPRETRTLFKLVSFGFDVETIIPSNIPKSRNPDLLMLGTFWEMKGPKTTNRKTVTAKFRKAVRQANGKAIFDLREINESQRQSFKDYIVSLLKETRGMRRVMIIMNENELLDITK